MEIKRVCIFGIGIISCVLSLYANTKKQKTADPPEAVVKFTDNIQMLAVPDLEKEEAYNITEDSKRLFPEYPTGINIGTTETAESEFPFLGLPEVMTSSEYCRCLYQYIYEEKRIKYTHQIESTYTLFLIDADGRDEPYLYETTLKTNCIVDNYKKDLRQIVTVKCEDGLIQQIRTFDNNMGMSSHQKPELSEETGNILIRESQDAKLTERQYLNLAARYYTAKDYGKTYAVLEQLIEDYDNSAEGWYRLALLVNYKRKWSKKLYSNPRRTALSFMEKASNRASGALADKIENILYYWEHPNHM